MRFCNNLSFLSAIVLFLISFTTANASFLDQHYYIAAQAGFNLNNMNQNDSVPAPVSGLEPLGYNTNGGNKHVVDFGLNAGFISSAGSIFNMRTALAWGLGYYSSLNQPLTGEYTLIAGTPANDTYKYHVNMQRLMLEGQLLFDTASSWTPFVGAGIGYARLKASPLTFTRVSGFARQPNSYASTANNLGVSVTAGLGYLFSSHWQARFGVSQLWLGKIHLKLQDGTTSYTAATSRFKPLRLWLQIAYGF